MSADREPSSGDESQSAHHSRPPLSNRADPEKTRLTAPETRIAESDGTELREELTYDSLRGVEAVPWREGIGRFDEWYEESRAGKIVVENERGERTGFNTPNRFTPDYREMLYAKAQALERGLRQRWGKLLHTAMLTLTCSTTDGEGNLRSPVDHLEELLSSWEAVRRELSRTLEGREFEYLAILEPHTERSAGYAHIHLGVFVKGPVVAEQFRSVLDAHLRNCDGAGEEAHRVFDEDGEEDTVSVRQVSHPSRQDGVENLGAYLSAYMAGEYGAEATEMPEYVRGFYTVMWATGRQWFRPSNGAQELMQPDDDGEGLEELAETWELVGLAPDGDLDGEVIEFDPEKSRGSVYRRIHREKYPPPDGGVDMRSFNR